MYTLYCLILLMVGTSTNNYANSSLWLECVRVRIACSFGNLTILSGQTLLFRLVRRKSVETQAPPIGPAFQGPNPPRSHVRSGKMVDIWTSKSFQTATFLRMQLHAESTKKKAVSKGSTAKSVSILYGYNHQSSFSTYLSFVWHCSPHPAFWNPWKSSAFHAPIFPQFSSG